MPTNSNFSATATRPPSPPPNFEKTLLEVIDLRTYFHTEQGLLKAVNGVSFTVRQGEALGIVGESGCGKSITVRSVMRLIQPPGEIVDGRIIYHQENGDVVDVTALSPRGRKIRDLRGGDIAMIFQEPMTSLSPIYTIGEQIVEAVVVHQNVSKRKARERAIELLRRVNIAAPEKRVDAFQHEISGGMRQRAMIALALSCNPRLLIADEPTTALDVTIEAQILALIKDMQRSEGMSLIMITHDLGVIAEMADSVVVMYVGEVVERGTTREVLADPKHPYTLALLNSIPRIGRREMLEPIRGSVPNPYQLPRGCKFAPRCPKASDICKTEPPDILVGPGRAVKCWLYGDAPKEAS